MKRDTLLSINIWVCISLACSTSSQAGKFDSGETYPKHTPENRCRIFVFLLEVRNTPTEQPPRKIKLPGSGMSFEDTPIH